MRIPPRSRRGMTIIEVVTALALLVGVGAMTTGAIGFMSNGASTDRVRLAAYEAAHRLLLQYIDDPRTIEGQRLPIEVDGIRFVFDFERAFLIDNRDAETGVSNRRSVDRELVTLNEMLTNRLEQVRVKVWLAEDTRTLRAGEPIATVTRVHDIVNSRNILDFLLGETAETRDSQ